MNLRDWFDLEQPEDRPRTLLHPLYGRDRRDERTPVAVDEHLVAGGRLVRVLGLAKVVARAVAQLVAEPHGDKVTSRAPW